MAWVALAAAAVSAVSSIQQGNAQAANLKSEAAANTRNADIQRENAARVSREAGVREDNLRRQQAQFFGRQRAGQAESGTGLGTGTNLDVAEQDMNEAELDALTVRYEGASERRAYLSDANALDFQAKVNRSNASSARKSGYLNAFGSMLGGVGRYSQAGGFSSSPTPYSSTRGSGTASQSSYSNGSVVTWNK